MRFSAWRKKDSFRATRACSIGYTTAELAGGFTLRLNPSIDVYGEAGKLFDIGGDSRVKSGVQGSLGTRVKG